MLSVLARITLPGMGSLCASKTASLRMTGAVRSELAAHNVRVLAILPGAIDTDMSRDFSPPKLSVSEVVNAVFDALDGDTDEVYVGEMAIGVAAGLAVDRRALQMQFASYL
jgi:NAD(P)-dependent dehydrogenase (short-subunit alcohol dehydrogenase family)